MSLKFWPKTSDQSGMDLSRAFVILSASFLLAGCGQVVDDFVKGVKTPNVGDISTGLEANRRLQLSSGQGVSVGNQLGGKLKISTTQRPVIGTTYSARISTSQQRQ